MDIALAELLGKRLSPIDLTGRAVSWTVRGVGLIPTWGKSVFSLKRMYNEYFHLLFHVYI